MLGIRLGWENGILPAHCAVGRQGWWEGRLAIWPLEGTAHVHAAVEVVIPGTLTRALCFVAKFEFADVGLMDGLVRLGIGNNEIDWDCVAPPSTVLLTRYLSNENRRAIVAACPLEESTYPALAKDEPVLPRVVADVRDLHGERCAGSAAGWVECKDIGDREQGYCRRVVTRNVAQVSLAVVLTCCGAQGLLAVGTRVARIVVVGCMTMVSKAGRTGGSGLALAFIDYSHMRERAWSESHQPG